MPDLLTHLLLGGALAIAWRPKTLEECMLILLGSTLVDVERPFSVFLIYLGIEWLELSRGCHSILGAFCLSFLASALVESDETTFPDRLKLVCVASFSHLLTDLTMQKWEETGLYLLYPLKINFSFNLVWSGEVWFPLVGLSAILIAIAIRLVTGRFLCNASPTNERRLH